MMMMERVAAVDLKRHFDKSILLYEENVFSCSGWKKFFKTVCDTVAVQDVLGEYRRKEPSRAVFSRNIRFWDQTIRFELPPQRSCYCSQFSVDAAVQASDGIIVWVEGNDFSMMSELVQSIRGREEYDKEILYPVETEYLYSLQKPPEVKRRGMVVVFVKGKHWFMPHKQVWKELCKSAGYPFITFNANADHETIQKKSYKILSAVINQINEGKGIEVKTDHFAHDIDFHSLDVANQE